MLYKIWQNAQFVAQRFPKQRFVRNAAPARRAAANAKRKPKPTKTKTPDGVFVLVGNSRNQIPNSKLHILFIPYLKCHQCPEQIHVVGAMLYVIGEHALDSLKIKKLGSVSEIRR